MRSPGEKPMSTNTIDSRMLGRRSGGFNCASGCGNWSQRGAWMYISQDPAWEIWSSERGIRVGAQESPGRAKEKENEAYLTAFGCAVLGCDLFDAASTSTPRRNYCGIAFVRQWSRYQGLIHGPPTAALTTLWMSITLHRPSLLMSPLLQGPSCNA
jgi:hypothetical protein